MKNKEILICLTLLASSLMSILLCIKYESLLSFIAGGLFFWFFMIYLEVQIKLQNKKSVKNRKDKLPESIDPHNL